MISNSACRLFSEPRRETTPNPTLNIACNTLPCTFTRMGLPALVINPRCSLRIEEDQRVIVVAGLPMHYYRVEDALAEAYV